MTLKAVLLFFVACLVETATCYSCSYYDHWGRLHYLYCSSNLCCGPTYDRYCCSYTPVGSIVGGVIGFIIFVSIVATISCCCCACCPGYRYRSSGTVIVSSPGPNYSSTAPVAATTGPYMAQPNRGVYTEPPPNYQV